MKWELKRKPLSKRKQKQPEIREVCPVDGYGCLWRKRFLEKICFSLEWKSEGVMDDDSEEDEGEEDWLRQGWRSKTGTVYGNDKKQRFDSMF